jgi:hypothetical protein
MEFRPALFMAGPSDSHGELAWLGYLRDEAALVEATMAIAVQNNMKLSKDARARASDVHALRAVRMINKRLDTSGAQLDDGLLGAVYTLAFREVRKTRDQYLDPKADIAWSVLQIMIRRGGSTFGG